MKYSFLKAEAAVRAIGRWGWFDPKKGLVEGDLASTELGEKARLVLFQLVQDEDVV